MKNKLYLALLASAPLLGDGSCVTLQDPSCYPYAVNPPLTSPSCSVFGGRIDYLYWRPYSDDNAYANVTTPMSISASSNFVNLPQVQSHDQEVKYEWDSGFRIGVNAGVPGNEWRASLDWTHYLNSSSDGTIGTAGPTSYVRLAYLTDPAFSTPLLEAIEEGELISSSDAFGKWDLDFNSVDLVLERQFYVGHQVTLRPYGGLRAFFLKQRMHTEADVSYTGNFIDFGFLSATSHHTADLRSDYKAVGIVGGVGSTWDIFCDFGLYGDVSTSILYGKSSSSLNGILSSTAGVINTTSYQAQKNVNTLKATLDLAFGVEWRQSVLSDNYQFTLRAGWEEHLLFRQNAFLTMRVTNDGFYGYEDNFVEQKLTDVSLQGFVLSASVSY